MQIFRLSILLLLVPGVANAVTEALGLDRLGVDLGELDIGGGQIGFGRYIGDRTYVAISQEFSGEAGRQVSIEYRIGPDWKITSSTSTTGLSGSVRLL